MSPGLVRGGETPTPGTAGGPDPLRAPVRWRLRTREVPLDRPVVMGILNLTPDSFSDGGRFADVDAQITRAHALVEEGADLLDVGGESTRPGATPVPVDEELRRLEPFLARLGEIPVPVSIDTRRAAVAERALDAGVEIVNDVSGLSHDATLAGVVARSGAALVLMHMRGNPIDMTEWARYGDVVAEVRSELAGALDYARSAGVEEARIVLDPGIGFAKSPDQSLALLHRLDGLHLLGRPLLVGPSRKRFLAGPEALPPDQRVEGTLAACVVAWSRGARIFRVHDVRPARKALDVAWRIDHAGASS
ncbi:MAG: dihydropteroate synthase [Gemmatimonadota bacterium]